MKKICLSIVLVLMILSFGQVTAGAEQVQEDLIMELLVPHVDRAVEKYYGQTRNYDQEKLIKMKRLKDCESCFKAEVQVRTHIGALDPPYVKDRITFDIRGGDVTVIDYVHDSES